jgi:hypothetical protein
MNDTADAITVALHDLRSVLASWQQLTGFANHSASPSIQKSDTNGMAGGANGAGAVR